MNPGSITDVPGIKVGHYTDLQHATGCTVVLSDNPATGGIDVRGGAPGSRETEFLHPLATSEVVNGFMLTGGSVFGLATADGATRYLSEHSTGIKFGGKTIPLIPAAVIFDLGLLSDVCPGADDGYAACAAAGIGVEVGTVGAGTGATVGGLRGVRRRIKGGVGTASVKMDGDIVVGALIVVNSVGGIVDPSNGKIVAGPRTTRAGGGFEDSSRILIDDPPKDFGRFGSSPAAGRYLNTVIGVIATNARMDKKEACRVSAAGQDGIALAVRPAHTSNDGDTVFTMATGEAGDVPVDRIREAAVQATVASILNAIDTATSLGSAPSADEYLGHPPEHPKDAR